MHLTALTDVRRLRRKCAPARFSNFLEAEMIYRIAFPAMALLVTAGCSAGDSTAPPSRGINLGDAQGVISGSPSAARSGTLRAVKECSGFNGDPGSFCTIKVSNVREIELESRIYYLD